MHKFGRILDLREAKVAIGVNHPTFKYPKEKVKLALERNVKSRFCRYLSEKQRNEVTPEEEEIIQQYIEDISEVTVKEGKYKGYAMILLEINRMYDEMDKVMLRVLQNDDISA